MNRDEHVTLLFVSHRGFIPWAIRFFTGQRWSHVAIMDNAARLCIEAHPIDGVRVVIPQTVLDGALDYAYVHVPCARACDVLQAAYSQVGKPYDFAAIFGFLFHRDWQEDDRWFCFELAAWCFAKGGSPIIRADAVHRVTGWLYAVLGIDERI